MKNKDLFDSLKELVIKLSENLKRGLIQSEDKFKLGVGSNETAGQMQIVLEIVVLNSIDESDYGPSIAATIFPEASEHALVDISLLRSNGPILQQQKFIVKGSSDLIKIDDYIASLEKEVIRILETEYFVRKR